MDYRSPDDHIDPCQDYIDIVLPHVGRNEVHHSSGPFVGIDRSVAGSNGFVEYAVQRCGRGRHSLALVFRGAEL